MAVLTRRLAAVTLVATCALATCALAASGTTWSSTGARSGPTATVRVVRTPAGPVVANAAGMTLYVFVDDLLTKAASACTGDCAHDWVPAMASGHVHVASGITGRIGTLDRFGRGRQLTMDGRPLYTFSGDTPAETRGNGVGNLWWAMTPSGLTATSYRAERRTYGHPAPTTLTVVHTRFGPAVADSEGQALYAYTDDTPATSACQASWCLVDWPPLQVPGTPTAVPGITAALSVIDGGGGARQVVLGGHPLYAFAGDLHPGDVRGQGIGSDWLLVSPSGSVIRAHGPH